MVYSSFEVGRNIQNFERKRVHILVRVTPFQSCLSWGLTIMCAKIVTVVGEAGDLTEKLLKRQQP
jgi:hypothetical protein